MKSIKKLFSLIKQYKRGQTKNFKQLYDFCTKCLADGVGSVSIGNLYIQMEPVERLEGAIRICVKINTAIMVRYNGIMVRRRLFTPDEISIYVDRKRGCRIYVYVEEKGRVYRCNFGMNAPLKKLKKVFRSRYVNFIVNTLLIYDWE